MTLEGINDRAKDFIWFMDFCGEPPFSGIKKGKVRFYEYEDQPRLLFCCNRKMLEVSLGDKILYSSWNITPEVGLQLRDTVIAAKQRPPMFHLAGNASFSAIGKGYSSSREGGHNCFTWALEQLLKLGEETINSTFRKYDHDYTKWIVSATSRYLKDDRPSPWYQSRKTVIYVSTIAIILSAIFAFFILH